MDHVHVHNTDHTKPFGNILSDDPLNHLIQSQTMVELVQRGM